MQFHHGHNFCEGSLLLHAPFILCITPALCVHIAMSVLFIFASNYVYIRAKKSPSVDSGNLYVVYVCVCLRGAQTNSLSTLSIFRVKEYLLDFIRNRIDVMAKSNDGSESVGVQRGM